MLKHLFLSTLIFIFPFASAADDLSPTTQQKDAYRITTGMLAQFHYHKLNYDQVSAEVHRDYLEALDPWHVYFLQSDIDNFRQFEHTLQNFKNNDLSVPFLIYKVYRQRAEALNDWSIERLQRPFNLDGHDSVTYPDFRDKTAQRPYFATLEEVHQFQEKRLTDQIIRMVIRGKSEAEARKLLSDRYKSTRKGLDQQEAQDIFGIYMNAIANRFDPHTDYLSPRLSKDFDIGMSLSLQGIGAVLTSRDDEISIRELIKGGPAERSGKLKVGDKLLAVGQGKDGEMVDIVGWRLDKAVDLVRGKKGSTVRLKVETRAGDIKEVTLVRDEVKMEDSAISYTIEKINGKKIGVVDIPSFYMDFEAAHKRRSGYTSTSVDLEKALKEMQKNKIDGVLIDLRNNGGGALEEAIKTVGLLIKEGPVVMVSDGKQNVIYEDGDNGKISYEGPLAVLINRGSASASEIFAAAIQDYHRGIILGSNSFGKGTVQSMLDLSRFSGDGAPLGSVKYTTSTYHRVTGASTQLAGVKPDVPLPEIVDEEDISERASKYALPAVEIPAAHYQSYKFTNDALRQRLENLHKKRFTNSEHLKRYEQWVAEMKEQLQQREWSLNLAERKKQYEQEKHERKAYESAMRQAIPSFKLDDKRKEKLEQANLFVDEKAGEEVQDFVPDVELYESLNIFTDYLNAIK